MGRWEDDWGQNRFSRTSMPSNLPPGLLGSAAPKAAIASNRHTPHLGIHFTVWQALLQARALGRNGSKSQLREEKWSLMRWWLSAD